ncbi:SurA N-terminal domain-containing protein [Kitasatospora sp. NPDC003701]
MHRRTAVAGALLAASALAACGGNGLSPGTAAALDGRRIPVAAVEARVAELRDTAGGASADARQQSDGLARRAVTDLVLDAVVARAAADRGLAVGGAEVAAARTAEEVRYGGAGPFARVLASRGVPGAGIDDYLRRQLGIRRLAAAAGQDAGTPAGDTAVRLALAEAATALHLRVNPRYGTWDADRVALLPDSPLWLAP